MVQLSETLESFEALGIGVAATTYDDRETLNEFSQQRSIGFTLLSDKGGKLASALGILNMDNDPGDFAYGVPHPGILFIGPDGVVKAKFAVEGYRKRPPIEEVLAGVSELVQ